MRVDLPAFIYGSIMAFRQKAKNEGGVMDQWEFVEPEDVRDVYIDGIARVESLADGLLTRLWLYTGESLICPQKVIRARLVMPLTRALELNQQHGRMLREIHRATNSLKVVS